MFDKEGSALRQAKHEFPMVPDLFTITSHCDVNKFDYVADLPIEDITNFSYVCCKEQMSCSISMELSYLALSLSSL